MVLEKVDKRLIRFYNKIIKPNFPNAKIISGFRTVKEQEFLWFEYVEGKRKYPVAQPGHSAHNFGKAIDIGGVNWNTKNIKLVNNLLKNYSGIRWGGNFVKKDFPHFEISYWRWEIFFTSFLSIVFFVLVIFLIYKDSRS